MLSREAGVLRRELGPAFLPLLEPARFKGAWGGRGGGKDHFFCEQIIVDSLNEAADTGNGLRTVCVREIQKTLQESVKFIIEKKLAEAGYGEADGFKIYANDGVITTPRDGIIMFTGMQSHNAESFKSYDSFGRLYWTEAQQASDRAIRVATPTLRQKGSQLWFAWNPKDPPDAANLTGSIDGMLRKAPPPDSIVVEAQFDQNPWFYETEMVSDEAYARAHRTPEDYQHIWRGAYELRSERRVFKNWRRCAFEMASRPAAIYRFGCDFGFSVDPTVLVRMFVGRWLKQPDEHGLAGVAVPNEKGRQLFIDYEAYRIGCDIDFTPALFAGSHPNLAWKNPFGDTGIPGATRWKITADSANPQSISYLRRQGFNILPAIKGTGSIEEGVEFLKAYEIVIHERCPKAIDEFTLYSFKVDEKTGNILPILEDKKNHVIDACRYALEDVRRGRGFFG